MTKFKDYITEGINDKGIFKAVIMGGSSASGKSFVIKKISSGQIEPRIVNTDIAVEYFMKIDPQFDWEKYGDKSKQLTKSQLVNYLNSILPLWIDGTSSNPSAVLRRSGILKSIGYDVGFCFVDTPVETAIERNKARGRVVDEDFLRQSYKHSQKLKSYYSSEFKWFTEILNGEGELIDKVVLNAYKKMSSFFNSDIHNPIGKELKYEMIKNGYKYLIEHPDYDISYLKKLVDSWYRQ
jgi:predicted kinase